MSSTAQVIDTRLEGLIESLRAISRTTDPLQIGEHAGRGIRHFVPFDALVSISRRELPPGQYKVTRRIIGVRSNHEEVNPWKDWDRLETHRGGLCGDLVDGLRPRHFTDLYLRDDPALGSEMAEFGSCLAIPLYDGGQALNWNLVFRRSPDGFTSMEIELITLASNLLGQATRNMVTTKKVEQLNDKISTQLHEVAALQRSLLPAALPDIPGVDMRVSYEPCELAGGDYYDFTKLGCSESCDDPMQPWGIIMADVAGHGARAAVVMAILQTLTHSIPQSPDMDSPSNVLAYLNEQLLKKAIERTFVTAVCMSYDPRTRAVNVASAGHPPPRLKKPGHDVPAVPLEIEPAYPLGIDSSFKAVSTRIQLQVGDTIALFTDGIIESFNPQRAMFGLSGLDAAMTACSGDPECLIDSIRTALAEHEQGRQPCDDQTILAFAVRA